MLNSYFLSVTFLNTSIIISRLAELPQTRHESEEATSISNKVCLEETSTVSVRQAPGEDVAIACTVGLLIVISNLLVLIILKRTPLSDVRKKKYLLSLSTADLLVGVLAVVRGVSMAFPGLTHHGVCILRLVLIVVYISASMCTLTAMTANVYLRVAHPVRLHVLHRNTATTVIIFCIWMVSGFTGVTMLLVDDHVEKEENDYQCLLLITFSYSTIGTVVIIGFILPSALIIPMHIHVLLIQRRNTHRALQEHTPIDPVWAGTATGVRYGRSVRREFRHTVTIALLSATYILCWLPYAAVTFKAWHTVPTSLQGDSWAKYAVFMVYLNSLINPCLYVWRFREFRHRLLSLLQTCFSHGKCQAAPGRRRRVEPYSGAVESAVAAQASAGRQVVMRVEDISRSSVQCNNSDVNVRQRDDTNHQQATDTVTASHSHKLEITQSGVGVRFSLTSRSSMNSGSVRDLSSVASSRRGSVSSLVNHPNATGNVFTTECHLDYEETSTGALRMVKQPHKS